MRGGAASSRVGWARGALAIVLLVVLGWVWSHPAVRELTLDSVKLKLHEAHAWHETEPIGSAAAFFAVYVGISILAVFPVAILLGLLAGAVFGFWTGTILVCVASSVGATLAFLLVRAIGRDWVRARFGSRLFRIDRELRGSGAYYVFLLRLTPVIPFSAINVGMALTSISTPAFFTGSTLGMLPSSAAFVFAGRELASIQSTADVASPGVLLGLFLLGLAPITVRKLAERRLRTESR